MAMDRAQVLADGLAELGLSLPTATQAKLLQFVQLIERWNRVYNLTAVRDGDEMVTRHLLDSLVLLPYLQGEHILDLGTGAGLPGIPLALAAPDRNFVLLDAVGKKIRFVTQAIIELGLINAQGVHARVEAFTPAQPFDCVLTRAFSELPRTVNLVQSLLGADGRLLALQGEAPAPETTPDDWFVTPLQVPGNEGSRCLVSIPRGEVA
jgi:16S rRNA (guanine527-N7)-methyltransferase